MIDRFEQFSSTIAAIQKTIQKIKRDEMAQFGLKGPHVQCVVALMRNRNGLTVSQLCEICEMDKAAISRSVSELEEKGMLERRSAGEKLYRAPLKLTEAGLKTAEGINATVASAVRQAGEGLSDDDRLVFYRSLDLIAENLRRISREGVSLDRIEERNEE